MQNTLQCKNQSSQQRMIWPLMSTVLRQRNLDTEKANNGVSEIKYQQKVCIGEGYTGVVVIILFIFQFSF